MTQQVRIYEVGPRDGLQNESTFVPTEDKLQLIEALLKSGVSQVEASSFVHPRWIPALADADTLLSTLKANTQFGRITALVPNMKGFSRALNCDLQEIAVFMSASQTHNKRNINKTKEETYQAFEPVFEACETAGIRVRAYVSVVWGCPYEGKVDPEATAEVARTLLNLGAYEISLGDTIGVGNPKQTREILEVVGRKVPLDKIAMHMHDTWGRALTNCVAGLDLGVRTFDASIGGLGGCPYAPGASGNVSTEDLVALFHELGYETGIDWDALISAGALAQKLLGRRLPSRALAASLASC